MRKLLAITILSILAVLLSAPVASADKPPGVEPAYHMETGMCSMCFVIGDECITYFEGPYSTNLFTNGATGRTLFTCHMDLIGPDSPPWHGGYAMRNVPYDGCVMTSAVGEREAFLMSDCPGWWIPAP